MDKEIDVNQKALQRNVLSHANLHQIHLSDQSRQKIEKIQAPGLYELHQKVLALCKQRALLYADFDNLGRRRGEIQAQISAFTKNL